MVEGGISRARQRPAGRGWRAALALPCLAAVLACVPPLEPDVNGDGLVDDLDVAFVSDCLGQDPATVLLCEAADVDQTAS